MRNNEPQRQENSRSRQILFFILIYLLLTWSDDNSQETTISQNRIKQIIKDQNVASPSIDQLFSLLEVHQFVGTWSLTEQALQKNNIFVHQNGKFKANFNRYGKTDNLTHVINVDMNDGEYIDDGEVVLRVEVNRHKFSSLRLKNLSTVAVINDESTDQNLTIAYEHNLILQNLQNKLINISQFIVTFAYNDLRDKIDISLAIIGQDIEWELDISHQTSNIFSVIVFAMILLLIAVVEFSSIIAIYKDIFDGVDNASAYSVITVLICTLWDATVSIFSFSQAFSNDESLILFIIPSFMFLLLFMNLELRFIMLILQSRQNQNNNIRQIICKFNLLTYGSLILIYPLLYFVNLSSYLYLATSFLLLPQILNNGQNSIRPKLLSPFYKSFIPIRFILILYFKCFPWNIYEFQPNYLLGIACILILGAQYFMLWVQAVHGPRKVIPSFLLPKIYNYQCKLQQNLQEGTQIEQCSICLSALNLAPTDIVLDFQVNFRIMKSPCGHRYHGPCLVKWMQVKMECPQCRSPLPPFQ